MEFSIGLLQLHKILNSLALVFNKFYDNSFLKRSSQKKKLVVLYVREGLQMGPWMPSACPFSMANLSTCPHEHLIMSWILLCNSPIISYNFMRSHWCRTTDSNIKLFFKRGRKAHRGKGSKWVVPSAFWTPAWLSFLTCILLWVHTFCAIRHWSLTIL